MSAKLQFSADFFNYKRLKTQEVNLGILVIGGNNPIVVQSMTNTNTLDTQATVEQCIRIIKAGGELVRITVQNVAEAENLKNIKTELLAQGYKIPLAADIHFNPKAAEVAAQYVEKVRINPGNYSENNKKSDYSEDEYQQALNKTAKKLQPLIEKCKKHKTAIRIGVNHGSLSNRILSRFGNTAQGMLESALEFIKIFEDAHFFDLIISLKSSNVLIMMHSNRLLAARMLERGRIYPIHLGVTEAGNGLEGRQKSIAGIASLLNDGIGDTIRVSLTEAPENEIPLAIMLRNSFKQNAEYQSFGAKTAWFNPYSFNKRISANIKNIGGKNPALVILPATQRYSCKIQKPFTNVETVPPDFLYIETEKPVFLPAENQYIQDFSVWKNEHPNCYPLLNKIELLEKNLPNSQMIFVKLSAKDLISKKVIITLKNTANIVLVLSAESEYPIAEWRKAFYLLNIEQINTPVILHRKFNLDQNETLLVETTKVFSALMLDGFGDGIWIQDYDCAHIKTLNQLSFGILQSCRLRLTQTEYIACPSCGRTLFNIEERLDEIKKKTKHLKHLKIAIMGCLVNGLGEMADADYGYVGSGKSKVNLYKGKELLRKNITEEDASDALVDLIKAEGDWRDY